jgi:hypothetical protein
VTFIGAMVARDRDARNPAERHGTATTPGGTATAPRTAPHAPQRTSDYNAMITSREPTADGTQDRAPDGSDRPGEERVGRDADESGYQSGTRRGPILL